MKWIRILIDECITRGFLKVILVLTVYPSTTLKLYIYIYINCGFFVRIKCPYSSNGDGKRKI